MKLSVVETLADFKSLEALLASDDLIAFDTETTGLDIDSKIIGISICNNLDEAYYVIFSKWDVTAASLVDLETLSHARQFLQFLSTKNLVMHNSIFDCNMVKRNFDVDLMPAVHTDTMLLAHLVDENRSIGLKELGQELFGESAKAEQTAMKESITKNGGSATKTNYELYKADAHLIGEYGAKDAWLTLAIFYELVQKLFDQNLDKFFYEEETMPLLRGPSKSLNATGLKVDLHKLDLLRKELEGSIAEALAFIQKEVEPYVKEEYPGTGKTNKFNINSPSQLSWLVFNQLQNPFTALTKEGRDLVKALNLRMPYTRAAQRDFIETLRLSKGRVWKAAAYSPVTGKKTAEKKIKDWWTYVVCDKAAIAKIQHKYKWAERLLQYKKDDKLLNTYVIGIQERQKYNIIRPEFKQAGTTSGRYSSKNPNFQNLPRDDKRIKSCIVSRPGKLFVGADYSQLEPRVFASASQDERLLQSFASGDDFYSVIGAEVFEIDDYNISLKKEAENSFASRYPAFRNIAKTVALSATYGTTASKMAGAIGKSTEEAQEVIDNYFKRFPKVKSFMLRCHNDAKEHGQVVSLFGRPRRMPQAKDIKKLYGQSKHEELPYQIRNVLNLAVNHVIQSTAASIMNRAAIAIHKTFEEVGFTDCKIVLQVHDEIIIECPEEQAADVAEIVKVCMETTVSIQGVDLIAEPKIANNLGDLK